MSTARNVPRFAEIAAQLAENGYEPLPLHFGQKRPCAGEGWSHYKFQQRDLRRFAAAGTGILCGRAVGLDIDVRDERLAAKLEALAEERFGPAPRRIGQPPKVLRVLQAEAPFAKMATQGYRLPGEGPEDKTHRVEILASGQQFVAYNKHPDTCRPYEWNGVGDPLSVPIGLLPMISEASAREFIAAAEKLLAEHGKPVGKLADEDDRRHHEPNEEQVAADSALLRQALAAIPNDELQFDDWIRVLYAVKGALGDNGLRDFLAWSAKSPKDRPEFSTREFLAAKPTRIGAGTIYHLAQSFGWKRPGASREPPWPRPIDILSELAAAPFDAGCVPEELGRYAALYAHATGFDPSITLTAAVSAAAAALSDDFRLCADSETQWFESARLWFLTIAHPGAGKTPGQREMMHALRELHTELARQYEETLAQWKRWVKQCEDESEAGPEPPRPRVIVDDTTIEKLVDVLRDNPRGIYIVAEEFDSWLGSLDQYRGGEISRDRGQWLAAFDGGPHTVERVKRGTMFVPNWGASILTATTPAGLARLTRHLPIDGLIQRFIPVIAGRRRHCPLQQRPERAELEAERTRYRETIRRLWDARPHAHRGVVQLSLTRGSASMIGYARRNSCRRRSVPLSRPSRLTWPNTPPWPCALPSPSTPRGSSAKSIRKPATRPPSPSPSLRCNKPWRFSGAPPNTRKRCTSTAKVPPRRTNSPKRSLASSSPAKPRRTRAD